MGFPWEHFPTNEKRLNVCAFKASFPVKFWENQINLSDPYAFLHLRHVTQLSYLSPFYVKHVLALQQDNPLYPT